MTRSRIGLLALSLALLMTAMTIAPAAAGSRVKSTYQYGGFVSLGYPIGVWGDHADFFATWKVQSNSNGTTTVKWLGMDNVIRHGKTCSSHICSGWTSTARAVFKTGSGQVLKTVYPPKGSCYSAAFAGNSKFWRYCRQSDFILPASLSKVTFTWTVSVKRPDGHRFTWQKSKTVKAY